MKTKLALIFILSLFIFSSCKDDSNPVTPPPDENEIKLSEKAKVFEGDDFSSYFQSFSQDSTQITFDSSVKDKYSFSPGDIIISTEGRGYIAKVVSVQDSGGAVIVTTTDGSICEAIEQGHSEFTKTLDLTANGVQFKPRKGVKLISVKTVRKKPLNKPNADEQTMKEVTLEVLLYDFDGDPETDDDQIHLNIVLTLSPTVSGSVDISGNDINSMTLTYEFEESLEMTLDVPLGAISGELDKDLKKTLGEWIFPTFILPGIPVTITPALELNVGAEVALSSVLTMGVTQNYSYTFTMNYLGNSQWETSEEHTSDYGFNEPTITAGLEAEAYVKPNFLFKVYQTLSPYLFAKLYGKFEAKTDMDPWWRLFAGLDAGVGIKMKVWNFTLFDFQETLLSLEKQIAQAESDHSDYITVTKPSAATVWNRGDQDVKIEWDKGNATGNVKIELYKLDELNTIIKSSTPNSGSYNDWDVPDHMITGKDFKIKITSLSDQNNFDFSPAFEISDNGNNLPPYIAQQPQPVNFSEEQSVYTTLAWQCSDPDNDPLTYRVYFGTSDDPNYVTTVSTPNYYYGKLQPNTTYFWRIDATDNHGHTTEGLLWQFTTGDAEQNGILFYYVGAGNYIYGEDNQTKSIDYDYQISEYETTNLQYVNFLNELWSNGELTFSADSTYVEGYYDGDEHFPAGTYRYYQLKTDNGRIALLNNHFAVQSGYEKHPVVNVTWFGANAFAKHFGLSLPTEEEWEKAARGTIGGVYPWGNGNINGNIANYLNSGDPWDNGTAPIGYYNGGNGMSNNASPYSAFDMAGNVAEWTNSFYLSYDANRVVRGGSWNDNPEDLKTYLRVRKDPLDPSSYIGFRCAKGTPGANRPPSKPHDPIPPDGSFNQLYVLTLNWECEDPDNDPLTYDLYFGTTDNPPLIVSGISTNSYTPDTLAADQIYYWKVVVHDSYGHTVEGDVWMFSTIHATNHPPNEPSDPNPPDESNNNPLNVQLMWSCSDPDNDPLTFDVYFGEGNNPPLVAQSISSNSYSLPELEPYTSYNWRIYAHDDEGMTSASPYWSFATGDGGGGGGDDFEWITIPAGDFTFGSGDTIKTIPYDYQIMKYEVTFQQFTNFLNSALNDGLIDWQTNKAHYDGDEKFPEGDYTLYDESSGQPNIKKDYQNQLYYVDDEYKNFPAANVSWPAVRLFAEYYGLEIPTEYEWEKAARGNTGYDYPWGDNEPTCDLANFFGCQDNPSGGFPIQVGKTTGVSPYGVYDMAGNVKEYIYKFHPYIPYGVYAKGGSFLSGALELRSWDLQSTSSQAGGGWTTGFRCVKK